MGYYLVYGKRKNFWGEGFTEYGELIGFKADKFELVKQENLEFAKVATKEFKNKIDKVELGYLLKQKNNFQIVELAYKDDPSKKIIIFNTHVYWNPEFDHIKQFQITALIEYINIHYKPQDNVIIAGDLNLKPVSSAFLFMTQNLPPDLNHVSEKKFKESSALYFKHQQGYYEHGKEINKIPFKSAYQNYDQKGNHPKFTTYVQFETLDYVLYNSQSSLILTRILKIPNENKLFKNQKIKALPNILNGSDHLPVLAEFILK